MSLVAVAAVYDDGWEPEVGFAVSIAMQLMRREAKRPPPRRVNGPQNRSTKPLSRFGAATARKLAFRRPCDPPALRAGFGTKPNEAGLRWRGPTAKSGRSKI